MNWHVEMFFDAGWDGWSYDVQMVDVYNVEFVDPEPGECYVNDQGEFVFILEDKEIAVRNMDSEEAGDEGECDVESALLEAQPEKPSILSWTLFYSALFLSPAVALLILALASAIIVLSLSHAAVQVESILR